MSRPSGLHHRSWGSSLAVLIVALHPGCSHNPSAPSDGNTTSPARIDVARATDGPLHVSVAQTLQLKAVATYSDGKVGDVTSSALWRSSDPSIAVVGTTGVVQAGKTGAVDVTASVGSVFGVAHVDVGGASGNCAASTLSSYSSSFTALTGIVRFGIVTPFSDCRWTATSDASWLALDHVEGGVFYDPGQSGDGSVFYIAASNNSLLPRTARIAVAFTDGTTLDHRVSQTAATCAYNVDLVEQLLGAAGGT